MKFTSLCLLLSYSIANTVNHPIERSESLVHESSIDLSSFGPLEPTEGEGSSSIDLTPFESIHSIALPKSQNIHQITVQLRKLSKYRPKAYQLVIKFCQVCAANNLGNAWPILTLNLTRSQVGQAWACLNLLENHASFYKSIKVIRQSIIYTAFDVDDIVKLLPSTTHIDLEFDRISIPNLKRSLESISTQPVSLTLTNPTWNQTFSNFISTQLPRLNIIDLTIIDPIVKGNEKEAGKIVAHILKKMAKADVDHVSLCFTRPIVPLKRSFWSFITRKPPIDAFAQKEGISCL